MTYPCPTCGRPRPVTNSFQVGRWHHIVEDCRHCCDAPLEAAKYAKRLTTDAGRRQLIQHLVAHDPEAVLRARDRLAARGAVAISTEGT